MSDIQRVIETSILGNDDGGIRAVWVPTDSNYISNMTFATLKEDVIPALGMKYPRAIPTLYIERELPSIINDFITHDLLIQRQWHMSNIDYLKHYTQIQESNPNIQNVDLGKGNYINIRDEISRARAVVDPENAYIRELTSKISQEICYEPSIIVERSPPTLDSLLSILKTGSGVVIGSWVGIQGASVGSTGYNSMILFAAVPLGIIVCGGAAGIAEGLQAGLKKKIVQLISPTKPRARREIR